METESFFCVWNVFLREDSWRLQVGDERVENLILGFKDPMIITLLEVL